VSLSKRLKDAGYKGPHPCAEWESDLERAARAESARRKPLPGQTSFLADAREPRPARPGQGLFNFDDDPEEQAS